MRRITLGLIFEEVHMAKKVYSAPLTVLGIRAIAAFIACWFILVAVALSIRIPFLLDHPIIPALLAGLSVGFVCVILPGEVQAEGCVRRIKFKTEGAIARFLLGFSITVLIVFEAPRSTVLASPPSLAPVQSSNAISAPGAEALVQVSGFVRDVNERGLPNVNVIMKKGPSALTDANGRFLLRIPKHLANSSNALEVSRLGFTPIHHELNDADLTSIYLHLGPEKTK